ncbi:MAG: hypothetical protein HY816_08035 [Candidatus Wallbacteria bacterium]|nr:hypothetical protein [Candidatus Wallbacteria bacterium]
MAQHAHVSGRKLRTLRALGMALAIAAAAIAEERAGTADLRELYREARQGGADRLYGVPAQQELARFEQAMESWLTAGTRPTLEDAGFGWFAARSRRGEVQAILEIGAARSGGGVFFVAWPPAREPAALVLEAPHSFFDLKTGELALALFDSGLGSALAVNTVHRKRAATDGTPGGEVADVAHNDRNYFHAFTEAAARAFPACLVVQLHGFDGQKRKPGVWADFVLSDGSGQFSPGSLLERAGVAFAAEFGGDRVQLSGRDTLELTAARNAQGAMLRKLGSDRFLHVEMTARERDRLATDPEELARLRHALERVRK